MNVEELQIGVPWGYIAAKAWGNNSNEPILVFHGYLDNAASFDQLIPYLPQNYYYICIDLPGHGKSSHLPSFFPYHSINYILVYKLLLKNFGKKKYILLGHSFGGQLALHFTLLYPDMVDKLIIIEASWFRYTPAILYKLYLENIMESVMDIYERMNESTAPVYTFEEVLNKAMTSRHELNTTTMPRKALEAIVSRNLIKVADNKYKISVDQRLKKLINSFHHIDYAVEVEKNNPRTCPTLFIYGKQSKELEDYKPFIDELYKNKMNKIILIDGKHDIHAEKPEIVGSIISKFLLDQKNKL